MKNNDRDKDKTGTDKKTGPQKDRVNGRIYNGQR